VRHKLELFRRPDRLWAWRLLAASGRVIAVDGGDGFEDKAAAANTARQLLTGDFDLVAEPVAQSL
jgi:uncharacterized protein YegP (UPF0339 family)